MFKYAILLAVTAVLLAVLNLEVGIDASSPTVRLGDTAYSMEPVVAPVVAGWPLSLFSVLLLETIPLRNAAGVCREANLPTATRHALQRHELVGLQYVVEECPVTSSVIL